MLELMVPPKELIARFLSADPASDARDLLLEGLQGPRGPEELLLGLKSEAERYWTIDPHTSLRLSDALAWAADQAGRPDQHALGLMAIADALRYLGRYAEAMAHFEAAAREFRKLGDEVGWARTRIGWVFASHYVGAAPEALPIAAEARAVLVAHHEWFRAAALALNTASVNRRLGHYTEALRLCDEALQFYARASAGPASVADQVPLKSALATANKANVLTLLGEFGMALELHQHAYDTFVQHGDVVSALKEQHNIAQVYAGRGHFTQAMRMLTDAVADAEQAGLDAVASEIVLDLIDCTLTLNGDADALELATETIERLERSGTPTEAAQARFLCGLAYARLGEPAKGLDLLAEAADVFDRAGLSNSVALAALARAGLHLAAGDWQAAWDEATRAHQLFTAQGLPVRQAQAELVQARAALRLNDPDQAVRLARSALTRTQGRSVLWLAHESHHVLASVARAKDNVPRALAEYERAMHSIERIQAGLTTDLRSNFLADKMQVFDDSIEYCLQLGRAEDAFQQLERAKARGLVDYLARTPEVRMRSRVPGNQDLVDELARLREEHASFYTRLYGLRAGEGSLTGSGEVHTLEGLVQDRERRIGRLLQRLALHAADDDPESGRGPSEVARVRPPLSEGTVLLEFYFREESGAVFVMSPEGILAVAPLAAGARSIRRISRSLHLVMDATARTLSEGSSTDGLAASARSLLGSLYNLLLAPVASQVSRARQLVIVPYGPLHGIPFAALYDGARHLVETHEVSTCPSSRLLGLCAFRPRRAAGSALILAHSNRGRLPHVLEEAEVVGALLQGEVYVEDEARRSVLTASAAYHPVIHLAAHGEARLDNPRFGYIQLADGQLSTADVFNLDLDGAIVTLSACETGLTGVSAGDELTGLSRGFLHAGASTLVQSLWRVEDRATAGLMERFYTGLRAGERSVAALRAAQLHTRLSNGAHPFFWAPFQLVGDPERVAV